MRYSLLAIADETEKLIQGFSMESIVDPKSTTMESLKAKNVLNDQFFEDIAVLNKAYSIISTEGMCVNVASILDAVIPNFINESTPIGSFTKEPTPIKVGYALEAIESFGSNSANIEKYKV